MPSLADLIRMGKQYVKDALPGGSLNPEAQPVADQARYIGGITDPDNSQIGRDLQTWHKRTQAGLADQLAGKQTPEAEYAYQSMMQAAGVAPVGMIAYHGSPHKFDKFSLDKIGTGEGAQAYGHGLYLAENPAVAKDYAGALSAAKANRPVGNVDLTQAYQNLPNDVPETLLAARRDFRALNNAGELSTADRRDFLTAVNNNLAASKNGQLYKTDIPDEAVARFLDWDKPLSQQAPEVQAALGDLALKNQAHIGRVPIRQFIYDKTQQTGSLPSVVIGEIEKAGSLDAAIPALQRKFSGANDAAKSKLDELLATLKQQQISMQTGVDSVRTGGDIVRGGYNPPEIAQMLQSKGIPGIRYLDGGSRSAGQGSSNFVAFDPEMIRILERNGVATGAKPWAPGEYGLKDLIPK